MGFSGIQWDAISVRLPPPQAIVVRHSMTFLLAPAVQRAEHEVSDSACASWWGEDERLVVGVCFFQGAHNRMCGIFSCPGSSFQMRD